MLTMVMKIMIREWKYFVFQNVNNGDEDTDSGMEILCFSEC
jgi:hypothetical protein